MRIFDISLIKNIFFSFLLISGILYVSIFAQSVGSGNLPKNTFGNQFKFAPVDGSFLYETRYIPNISKKNTFLPPKLNQEIIQQKLEKDNQKNFVKNKQKKEVKKKSFTVDSSTWIKILFLVIIIVIFTAYKLKIKKNVRG